VSVRLATGPVSFGVDFAGDPANPPWPQVLDGIAEAGYAWTELGPLGYLPAGAAGALAERGLRCCGGFVFEPLHEPDHRPYLLDVARRTARAVAEAGGRYLLLIDLVDPERARTAGRPDAARRLTGRERTALREALAAAADVAYGHGLRPLLHPHAGTHVEFLDEIEPLLDGVELCLDTGHLAYAGIDPVALYERWADRVGCIHLKDLDGERTGGGFWDAVRRGAFRPLGEGGVDFEGLFAALARHGFDGWAVVEQDRVPGGTPVADLVASRRFVEALR
jgi:inosose dehydratase